MASRRSGPSRRAITNLLGGVSQQPNTVRLDNQCEVQDNAYSSVVDGLGKRQPSEHVGRLNMLDVKPGLTRDEALIHWIDRDTSERYAVVLDYNLRDSTKPGIFIYDLSDGALIPLTGKDGGVIEKSVKDYIEEFDRSVSPTLTPNHRRDLKVITIADTTYILNKTKKVGMDITQTPWDAVLLTNPGAGTPEGRVRWGVSNTLVGVSKSARRWFLFQRTANPLSKYSVITRFKTAPERNPHPNFWDPPFGDDTIPLGDRQDQGTSWVKTYNLNPEHRPGLFGQSNIKGFGRKEDVPPYLPLITGYGEHEGYQIGTIQTQEILDRLWSEPLEGKYDSGGSALSFYRGGIEANHNRVSDILTNATGRLVVQKDEANRTPGPRVKLPQKGPVLMVELRSPRVLVTTHDDYREKLSIKVDASGDLEDSLIVFSDEVARLSQLPLTCYPGHIVKITGLEDNENDEYYVTFKASDEDTANDPANRAALHEGSWEESLASLADYRIDNTTMPIKLVRVSDKGVFRFEIYHEDWTDRKVGDDDSNPHPSFIDETIEDIFLWRNRLGFLSGSRFIMSEADEYENFWRTTVRTLIDSDPIDIDAGHSDVADLRYATPLEEEMILWTDRTQFVVQGDPILTPRTAGLTPATEFECYPDVRPEVLEDGIFFALRSGGGEFSQIRQFHRVADAAGSFSNRRSSEQIPRYLPGKITEMTATSLESVMAVRTDDISTRNVIYIYKWHDDGPNRRILSSWFRYVVGPSFGTTVHGCKFYNDDLYMVVERTDANATDAAVHLEKITFSGQRQVDPNGATFRCLLDRRMSSDDFLNNVAPQVPYFNYDDTLKTFDIHLPYLVQADTSLTLQPMRIVSRAGTDSGPQGEQFAHTVTTEGSAPNQHSVLKIPDPIRDADTSKGVLYEAAKAGTFKFYVGQDYTMTYEFSPFSVRRLDREGNATQAVAVGRTQILKAAIPYEDTGYMVLTVSPALHSDGSVIVDRSTRVYKVPMLEVGLGRSYIGVVNIRDGELKSGIGAQPDEVRLVLTNDTPYPCNPKGITYVYNHTSRSRISAF